jgi:hypothetical protein
MKKTAPCEAALVELRVIERYQAHMTVKAQFDRK